jgi:hypothetical protein
VSSVARRGKKSTELDANELLLPFHPWLVDKIASELDPLPLFDLSLEAKERNKELGPDDKGMRELARRLIAQGMPDLDREEQAVEAFEVWDVMQRAKEVRAAGQGGPNIPMESMMFIFKTAGLRGPTIPYFTLFEKWLERPVGR